MHIIGGSARPLVFLELLGAEGDGTGFIIETARDSLVDTGSSLARRRSGPGRSRGQGRTGAWAGWPGSSG